MAFTFTDLGNVQGWPAAATTIVRTLSTGANVGDFCVAALFEDAGLTAGTYTGVITDSKGNTWIRSPGASVDQLGTAFDQLSLYTSNITVALAPGDTITCTVGYSGGFLAMNVLDIAGAATSSTIDIAVSAAMIATSTSVSTAAQNPSNPGEAVYVIGVSKGASGAASITSPTVSTPPPSSPFGSQVGTTGAGGTATLVGSPSTTGTFTYPSNANGGMVAMLLIVPASGLILLPQIAL